MFNFFRKNEDKPERKKLKKLDYILFAAIIFFVIYFGIQYIFFDFGTSPSNSVDPKEKGTSIWTIFRFFRIGIFEAICLIIVITYLAYNKFKKNREEDE